MAKFPTYEQMAKNVAEKALDEFLYDGKSIREWMKIIVEQEPCEDAISRQAVLDAFGLSEKTRKYGGDHSGYDTLMMYEIQDVLEDLPPVTPAPKTGRWIAVMNGRGGHECSECGNYAPSYKSGNENLSDFCPYCGADMKESEE